MHHVPDQDSGDAKQNQLSRSYSASWYAYILPTFSTLASWKAGKAWKERELWVAQPFIVPPAHHF